MADSDGARACELLTPRAQRGVVTFSRAHAGHDHPTSACERVIDGYAPLYGPRRIRRVSISGIEIHGELARASADGLPVALEKVDGKWKLNLVGLATDLGDTPPPQAR